MHQSEPAAPERQASGASSILIENVLRHALRRAVLLRGGQARGDMSAAVLSTLDVLLAKAPIPTADRVRWRTVAAESARAFPTSKLGRRLLTLPEERIAGVSGAALDLLASDRGGTCFGVRFIRSKSPLQIAEIASEALLQNPGLAGILLYDLDHHTTRRIDFSSGATTSASRAAR